MATNNNDDKSKIDKIREDLEKKLAALEKSKTNNTEENKEVDSVEELKNEITDSKEKVENETEKSSFLDQISNLEKESTIEEATIENDESVETSSDEQEDAIFEISDEIEDIQTEEKVQDKEKEEKASIVAPIPEVDNIKDASEIENNIDNNDTVKEDAEVLETEEEKPSKSNYLIYGIVILLLGTVGYFTLDYFKGKDKFDSEKTNKQITDLKNRRYQDSIKLLEAEKRLAEFESQRYIDSISLADRLQLKVENANKAKSDVAKKTKKAKAAKPTTTIYKNNKPVATSKSTVNFDKVVAPDNTVSNNSSTTTTDASTSSAVEKDLSKEIQDEKDKEIVKQVKKEKKIETLNTVEKAPIYPGCERKKTERTKKTCMISKINQFVNKNFNAYVAQDVGLDSGIQKIYVSFIIDRNGYVNVLRTRAKHEALKKEAVRVVNKLPRMKPALKNGEKTQIVYNLPIVFSVE